VPVTIPIPHVNVYDPGFNAASLTVTGPFELSLRTSRSGSAKPEAHPSPLATVSSTGAPAFATIRSGS
jgi:hypothetical protein